VAFAPEKKRRDDPALVTLTASTSGQEPSLARAFVKAGDALQGEHHLLRVAIPAPHSVECAARIRGRFWQQTSTSVFVPRHDDHKEETKTCFQQ
jgi:hypothetical protein